MMVAKTLGRTLVLAGTALVIAAIGALPVSSARAQEASTIPHFDPKGKPPSRHTLDVLEKSRAELPFGDKRDFEEQQKGFIAPMKDLKIIADDGHIVWNMEQFQFIEQQDSSIPSIPRCTASPG
jgi:alkyl sulfatase BDS1-like metallo-beta-lactamase superfamily hydrolase